MMTTFRRREIGPPRLFPAVGHREMGHRGERIRWRFRSETAKPALEDVLGIGKSAGKPLRNYAQHYVQIAKIAPHRTAWNLTVAPGKLLQVVEK